MLMEIYMKEIGKMGKQMDMAYLNIIMEANIRAIGRMIYSMVMAPRYGQMVTNIKVNTSMVRKMDKVSINGTMGVFIKETG